jgi:DNA-binding transcriptional MerR regulator
VARATPAISDFSKRLMIGFLEPMRPERNGCLKPVKGFQPERVARYTLAMKLDSSTKAELKAGVSQTRLAQLTELSASTLRGYEKEGLVPAQSLEGKKTYGLDALKALETIKTLRAEGLNLREIVQHLKPEADATETPASTPTGTKAPVAFDMTKSEAELRAQVDQLRLQLEAEREKLAQLANQIGTRVIRQRNELVLTKKELEELERMRESNIKRALAVTRRNQALLYSASRPGVLRFDPKKPKK